MECNATGRPIEPQATGVPNDFVDPNHPHFPHDPEAALPERPYKYVPFMSKKSTQIALAVIFVLLSYVAAALVGGKVGMNMAKRPAANETLYSTTTVFATTIVPYTLKPSVETSTSTMTIELPKPKATCIFVGDKNYMANADECNKDCSNFISDKKMATCKFDFALKLRCEVCDISSKTDRPMTFTSVVTKTVEAPKSAPACSFIGDRTYVNNAACNKECNNYIKDDTTSSCKNDPGGKLGCEVCKVGASIGPVSLQAPASSTPPPPPASSTPPPPPPPAPKKGISECFWTSRWSVKKECEVNCAAMDDKPTDEKPICNEERGFYKCRTCKAVQVL
jgi:hypothetical protein